ncbi:hypothetical protein F4778DRAFT_793617 [Xylariomycetidae sp. FL2044]|nr:hypothetical protein F4778DRAFT_793617 [Xylariomycetidae sp. FL2044]
MSSRRNGKAPQPTKRAPKTREELYKPRVMDHLRAKVVQTDEEYEAGLSEAAKQTERHLIAEAERAEAAGKTLFTFLGPPGTRNSNPPTSPGKRARGSNDDDEQSSDDDLVFLYSSPVKKARHQPPQSAPLRTAVKPTQKSSQKPTQKPAGKTTLKPSGKPAGKTTLKPSGKPAAKKYIRPAREADRRFFSFLPTYNDGEDDEDDGENCDHDEEDGSSSSDSGHHGPSSNIHDDFTKLSMTRKDPRYSHLFRN